MTRRLIAFTALLMLTVFASQASAASSPYRTCATFSSGGQSYKTQGYFENSAGRKALDAGSCRYATSALKAALTGGDTAAWSCERKNKKVTVAAVCATGASNATFARALRVESKPSRSARSRSCGIVIDRVRGVYAMSRSISSGCRAARSVTRALIRARKVTAGGMRVGTYTVASYRCVSKQGVGTCSRGSKRFKVTRTGSTD